MATPQGTNISKFESIAQILKQVSGRQETKLDYITKKYT